MQTNFAEGQSWPWMTSITFQINIFSAKMVSQIFFWPWAKIEFDLGDQFRTKICKEYLKATWIHKKIDLAWSFELPLWPLTFKDIFSFLDFNLQGHI